MDLMKHGRPETTSIGQGIKVLRPNEAKNREI